ncbi:MAG: hypothetical protein ACI89X_001567 [Planctomycetota bacterium]|jgi:hypothetical protein
MKPTTLLWIASSLVTSAVLAACASTIIPPTANEAEQIAIARDLLASRPGKAADTAEALLKQNPELREARLLLAESSFAMSRNPDFSGRKLHLLDATRNFQNALNDVENEPYARELRVLAEAYRDLGEWAKGSQAAIRSADGFQQRKGLENTKAYALARLVGADCDYRLFVDVRQPEKQDGEADMNGIVPPEPHTRALAIVAVAGYAEARLDYPSHCVNQLAIIQRWLDQNGEAIRTYERGIINNPNETAIHDAYINWMCELGQEDALVGGYRRFVREKPNAPILRWHQGRAIYARANRLRREGNFQGSIAIYQKSRDVFAEYLALTPQYRETISQWHALCDLSMARCAADNGDLEAAQKHLLSAGETSPKATEYVDGKPQLVDTYGNHFTGAAFAIHLALTESPDMALERTLKFNEAIVSRFPDQWGFIYNNAGLAARDLGVQLAANGDEPAAKELWERSYQHYKKAVALSPTDARIVNDCGLMLIYYLNRDLDNARQLCERAIEIGSAQLAEMEDDVSERDRHLLEEAVGDAWQNIAVLLRTHKKAPFEDYKRFCEEAVKFYPYQRREAAAMLRNKGDNTLGSTARGTASGSNSGSSNASSGQNAPQGGAAEALKKATPEIEQYAANDDFDSVLNVLDKLAKECKNHAPYRVMVGTMTWRLANQARDNNRKGTAAFYQDAMNAFKKAVELDPEPIEPRQMLAQAQFDSNEPQMAAETISSLLLHMQSKGGGTDEQGLAAHTLRANAASRAYAKAKSGGKNDAGLLTSSRTSMRWLEQEGKLTPEMLKLWSTTEQWAEAPAEATNVYVRASERAPADFAMLELVVSTAATQKQLPLAIASLKKRGDAGTVWYLGKAQYYYAGDQRRGGKTDDAMKTIDAAIASFTQSMTKNAGYKNSCEQWMAMCLGKQGNIAFSLKNYDLSEKLLLQATAARPDQINTDLGLTETTKRGILFLVDYYRRKNNLQKCESISRAAAEAAQGDTDLQNNSGLFARDYGNQIERNGKLKEAQEMYEQSYKAYGRAVQLDGKNVRLRNDLALIAIYHLDRDWDKVKVLLDTAIADGERTLQDSPPDDADEKQQLEEAVGDSYENLALWHIKHSHDGAAAKAAATKSQDYYPGKRRPGARRHLRSAEQLLQGK